MKTIRFISFFGIIYFIFHSIAELKIAVEISPTVSDFLYEFITYLFMLPLVIPALLGLFYFNNHPHKVDQRVILSYWVYAAAVALSAIIMYVWTTTDPLEVGMPMALLVLPVCVLVSVFLFFKILRK